MTRTKLILTIDGAAGPTARLLDWLREGGYTVGAPQAFGELTKSGGRRVAVEVQGPHGEVDARPHWLGKARAGGRR